MIGVAASVLVACGIVGAVALALELVLAVGTAVVDAVRQKAADR